MNAAPKAGRGIGLISSAKVLIPPKDPTADPVGSVVGDSEPTQLDLSGRSRKMLVMNV